MSAYTPDPDRTTVPVEVIGYVIVCTICGAFAIFGPWFIW